MEKDRVTAATQVDHILTIHELRRRQRSAPMDIQGVRGVESLSRVDRGPPPSRILIFAKLAKCEEASDELMQFAWARRIKPTYSNETPAAVTKGLDCGNGIIAKSVIDEDVSAAG